MTQFHFSNNGAHLLVDNTVTSIPSRKFSNNPFLTEVRLLEGLQKIGDFAFQNCRGLTKIQIPTTVKSIGKAAFEGCNSLQEVIVCEGLQIIHDESFRHCTSLLQINIPSSVNEIGFIAFDGCVSLKKVRLNDGLRIIGRSSFRGCASLTHIHIPPSVHTISECAFELCSSLKEVHLCNGLTTIGHDVFSDCIALRQIEIPSSVVSMGFSVFVRCSALTEIHLSDGLQHISGSIFKKCSSLLHLNIPSAIIDIKTNGHCPFLRNIAVSPSSSLDQDNFEYAISSFQDVDVTIDMLKARFDDLPIHRLCFYHSYQSMEHDNTLELLRVVAKQLPGHCAKVDCVGMTLLHILACSSKHDMRLYQCIMESHPDSLLVKDLWGEIPLAYMLLSETPKEIFHYCLKHYEERSDSVPFDFEGILKQAILSSMAEHVRHLIQSHRNFFPDLVINWQNLLDEICDANFPFDNLANRDFMREIYRVYQVIVEASLSSRTDCIDAFAYDLPDQEIEINAFTEIRNLTTQYVQQHRNFLMAASTSLELALWKMALRESTNVESKEERLEVRSKYGNICQVVIPHVLLFL